MRIRIDINEMAAMAETLQAGATALAEVGAEVCSCDLPSTVAGVFEQHRSGFRRNFDELAKMYRLHALNLLLRAIIATQDVERAVAIHPPAPAPTTIAAAPVVSVENRHVLGLASTSGLTAEQKREMNRQMGLSVVMPGIMSSAYQAIGRANASALSTLEMSPSALARKVGGIPTPSERKYYTPNSYKAR